MKKKTKKVIQKDVVKTKKKVMNVDEKENEVKDEQGCRKAASKRTKMVVDDEPQIKSKFGRKSVTPFDQLFLGINNQTVESFNFPKV